MRKKTGMEYTVFTNAWRKTYYQIQADVDQQERIILDLAAGKIPRDEFASWLNSHIAPL